MSRRSHGQVYREVPIEDRGAKPQLELVLVLLLLSMDVGLVVGEREDKRRRGIFPK